MHCYRFAIVSFSCISSSMIIGSLETLLLYILSLTNYCKTELRINLFFPLPTFYIAWLILLPCLLAVSFAVL